MEKNKQLEDRIKNEDKRAVGKLIVIGAVSMVGGGILGFCGTFFMKQMLKQGISLTEALEQAKPAVSYYSACVLILYTIIVTAVSAFRILTHTKQLKNWDGEDEEACESLDKKLNKDLLLTNLLMLGEFFLFGMAVADLQGSVKEHVLLLVFMLIFYFSGMIVTIVLQQKIVNGYKAVNPEKKGSIYDMKFQDKWFQSCDEGERAAIGMAAKKALDAVSKVCLLLEILLIICNALFSVGIMAHIIVIIIWSVANISYVAAGNKVLKK